MSISITINPEARGECALQGAPSLIATCGQVVALPVNIVNQGFVTNALEARLVDPVPEGIPLEFSEEPLKGIGDERRVLRVKIETTGPLDVTIAFNAKNGIPDLAGRGRIHLLAQCRSGQTWQ
jgi:hypothetical protein